MSSRSSEAFANCYTRLLYFTECGRSVDSSQHSQSGGGGGGGSFYSPNYPSDYPSDVVCHYSFQSHGRERVQIVFADFRLRYDASGASKHTLARKLAPLSSPTSSPSSSSSALSSPSSSVACPVTKRCRVDDTSPEYTILGLLPVV